MSLSDAMPQRERVRRPCPDFECVWHDPVLVYPDELTPALADVLGRIDWPYCATIADTFRVYGTPIGRTRQDERAIVVHWAIKLALQHGKRWESVANAIIDDMNQKIKAREVVARLAPEVD